MLLVYGGTVMDEAHLWTQGQPMNTPGALRSPFAPIAFLAGIVAPVWVAVYIGLYHGWLIGVLSWLAFHVADAVLTIVLGIRGPFIGFHFLAACAATPVGYWLTLASLP